MAITEVSVNSHESNESTELAATTVAIIKIQKFTDFNPGDFECSSFVEIPELGVSW